MVCATFPLVWVGGMVTTHQAGMAVPDWPNTYGYNLFLYPWTTWVAGPFDLFIEHGHRLLGASVGLLTLGFVVATFWSTSSHQLRWLSLAALLGVVLQGLLGGMRVVLDQRTLAMIHGCVGPAFFAFTVALATITAKSWRTNQRSVMHPLAGKLQRLAIATTLLAYLQLVLGAQLRHTPVDAVPGFFRAALYFHLIVAGALVMHAALIARVAMRLRHQGDHVFDPAMLLLASVCVQLLLGASTWVIKYGWPLWFTNYETAAQYVVRPEQFGRALIITAHVANGSLILASSLWLSLRSLRFLQASPIHPAAIRPLLLEVVA
jgi:cytochrome c oxidase assembly protein subunit 15